MPVDFTPITLPYALSPGDHRAALKLARFVRGGRSFGRITMSLLLLDGITCILAFYTLILSDLLLHHHIDFDRDPPNLFVLGMVGLFLPLLAFRRSRKLARPLTGAAELSLLFTPDALTLTTPEATTCIPWTEIRGIEPFPDFLLLFTDTHFLPIPAARLVDPANTTRFINAILADRPIHDAYPVLLNPIASDPSAVANAEPPRS